MTPYEVQHLKREVRRLRSLCKSLWFARRRRALNDKQVLDQNPWLEEDKGKRQTEYAKQRHWKSMSNANGSKQIP